MAGRQDVGLFFCFRHTSDLNVWSWYIVNDKLMIWKIVLGLHSYGTTNIFQTVQAKTKPNVSYIVLFYSKYYLFHLSFIDIDFTWDSKLSLLKDKLGNLYKM